MVILLLVISHVESQVGPVQADGTSEHGAELDRILRLHAIRSVFQPIVDLDTGRTVAYEALARGPAGSPLAAPQPLFAAARRHGRLRVRGRGWGIALDDVGAERASLALLPFIRPDVIKLDLGLVQGRPSAAVAEVFSAVNAESERSGAVVLAEGIETREHLGTARALGATLGQGWLLGRPSAAPETAPAAGRRHRLGPARRPPDPVHAGVRRAATAAGPQRPADRSQQAPGTPRGPARRAPDRAGQLSGSRVLQRRHPPPLPEDRPPGGLRRRPRTGHAPVPGAGNPRRAPGTVRPPGRGVDDHGLSRIAPARRATQPAPAALTGQPGQLASPTPGPPALAQPIPRQ